MEMWKKHQTHDNEINRVLKRDGCIDNKNRIRAWHNETWSKLEEAGHDSLNFKICKCREGT